MYHINGFYSRDVIIMLLGGGFIQVDTTEGLGVKCTACFCFQHNSFEDIVRQKNNNYDANKETHFCMKFH